MRRPGVALAQERQEIVAPGWSASIGANVWFSNDVPSKIASVDADVLLWNRVV